MSVSKYQFKLVIENFEQKLYTGYRMKTAQTLHRQIPLNYIKCTMIYTATHSFKCNAKEKYNVISGTRKKEFFRKHKHCIIFTVTEDKVHVAKLTNGKYS